MGEAKWYVVHTYSGYENKVKVDIEKTIENNKKLAEQILEVRVPMEDVVEIKNGVKKTVSRKLFPGYVLVNMDMNDETWYVVRNTRGVTGFVGSEPTKPVPLSEEEMMNLGVKAPVTELALEMGNSKVLNIIMLGVYVGYKGEIDPAIVWGTIEHKLASKAKLLPLNKQAFEKGLEIGRSQR
jgi:transcriptional antiterminator NusG